MKTNKKRKWGIFVYPLSMITCILATGIGSYYIYQELYPKKEIVDGYRKMENEKAIWFNSGKLWIKGNNNKNRNTDWDFKIKEYPYDNGKYWLGDEGLKKLRNTMKERLFFGQEITLLNDIVIGNTNIIDEKSNGLYFPLTKEIFLNAEQWKKYSIYDNNKISDDDKIEGIISTITHEYGHHIANMYFNTSYASDSWKDHGKIPVHLVGDKIEPTNWNPTFTENFYKILNYDQKTKTNYRMFYKNNKVTMSDVLSLYDLFWNANSQKRIKWPSEQRTIFGIDQRSFGYREEWRRFGSGDHNESFNEYRYTLDEIVTRQLGQLMHVYKIPRDIDDFGHMIIGGDKTSYSADSFIMDTNASTQIAINVKNSQPTVFGYDNKNGRIPIQKQNYGYYDDFVFGTNVDEKGNKTKRAEELYQNFIKTMGYGKLISNVYGYNNIDATANKYTKKISAMYNITDLNSNRMRISGWAPEKVKGLYYGKETKKDEEINALNVHRFIRGSRADPKIKSPLWQFNRKESVFANKRIKLSDTINLGKWKPYITSAYINAEWKFGKVFEWWIDQNNDDKPQWNEMISTSDILKTDLPTNKLSLEYIGAINERLPLSTFKQSWSEGETYPKVIYNHSDKKNPYYGELTLGTY